MARIAALSIYPVKSCRGIALDAATAAVSGFAYDREWMIVRPQGQFITQREEPRLALIGTAIVDGSLVLNAPEVGALPIALDRDDGAAVEVVCWRDRCAAFDAGEQAAHWLEAYLGKPYRLVRFDPAHRRSSDAKWTDGVDATTRFTDGFPYLIISQASLDDLNGRLSAPLPMNRFRPNIVVAGLEAYGEDRVYEFFSSGTRLRVVKPCTRCAVTTTSQEKGEREGDEPLRTLRGYRFSRELKGVLFGQNAILTAGAGGGLEVGQELAVDWQ